MTDPETQVWLVWQESILLFENRETKMQFPAMAEHNIFLLLARYVPNVA